MAARLQAASVSQDPVLVSHKTLAGHFPTTSLKLKIDGEMEIFS
jgi:hypothetical protein